MAKNRESKPGGRDGGGDNGDSREEKRKGKREGKKADRSRTEKESEWQERVVQIRRVTKVVKGGKKLSF
ncbi:MAG: 30S ribosomal protein S5, partial [Pseudanabaena sp.]